MRRASEDSSPNEEVTRSLRTLVQAKRRRGIGWQDSFRDTALELGVGWTAVRKIYYREEGARTHWADLRTRIADYLEREAEELIHQAEEYERKADALRHGRGEACENAGSASRRGSTAWVPTSSDASSAG